MRRELVPVLRLGSRGACHAESAAESLGLLRMVLVPLRLRAKDLCFLLASGEYCELELIGAHGLYVSGQALLQPQLGYVGALLVFVLGAVLLLVNLMAFHFLIHL